MDMAEVLAPLADMPEGVDRRVVCPICDPTRKKRNNRDLSIKRDGETILYHCWHCETKGKVSKEKFRPRFAVKPIDKQPDIFPLSDAAKGLLKERRLSVAVAEEAGLFSTEFYSRREGRLIEGIGFPYRNNGAIYASKIRGIQTKDYIQVGSCQTFWNLDRLESLDEIIITEGEFDALALMQCGFKNVVSVPNGAINQAPVNHNEDDRKFRYIWNAREVLDHANRVILAFDSDRPGQLLAEEVARRIGKHKCWNVSWGSHKDANGLLINSGEDAVRSTIQQATPVPVSGLYEASEFHGSVLDLFQNGAATGKSTGYVVNPNFLIRSRSILPNGRIGE